MEMVTGEAISQGQHALVLVNLWCSKQALPHVLSAPQQAAAPPRSRAAGTVEWPMAKKRWVKACREPPFQVKERALARKSHLPSMSWPSQSFCPPSSTGEVRPRAAGTQDEGQEQDSMGGQEPG